MQFYSSKGAARASNDYYLKQLHSNHSEHELQEVGNQHDIADSLNGYYHAFHYILANEEMEQNETTVSLQSTSRLIFVRHGSSVFFFFFIISP